jgi:hypothetical protein
LASWRCFDELPGWPVRRDRCFGPDRLLRPSEGIGAEMIIAAKIIIYILINTQVWFA